MILQIYRARINFLGFCRLKNSKHLIFFILFWVEKNSKETEESNVTFVLLLLCLWKKLNFFHLIGKFLQLFNQSVTATESLNQKNHLNVLTSLS